MQHEVDYVIVGAGSAGCVLANRLSADPRNTVLLLEAGGPDTNPWIHVPVGYFKTMHDPELDWCYRTEPDEAVAGRSIDWPRGKVLGGCSSLNGLFTCAASAKTTIAGPNSATRDGASTTCCRTS